MKSKVIAYYLPQFHPIKENDEWWGKGFTEWTNVAKAKPLFKGHYQPKVPADLGFYDLRLEETQIQQVELAKEAGVSAFCYWHYWFGGGKRLLEGPLLSMLGNTKIEFPFCLAWANHTWQKKSWNSDISRLTKKNLIIQEYPGISDVDLHFKELYPAFSDERYFKINGRLVFVIYSFEDMIDPEYFIDRWQKLSKEKGLPGFYFIGHTSKVENLSSPLYNKLDAINLNLLSQAFNENLLNRALSYITRRPLNVVDYNRAANKLCSELFKKERVFPTLYPNWDTTPRISYMGSVLKNSTPSNFKAFCLRIFELIRFKKDENQVVFLKSWNEWAEGNYMEPDLRYGRGYIKALKDALHEVS
jgi:hypothetical protein